METSGRLSQLQVYAKRMTLMRSCRARPTTVTECVTIQDPAPFHPSNVELKEENFLDLKTLIKNPGVVMEGKVLICRTLAPAYKALPLCTLIEDCEGEDAVSLALFNLFPEAPCTSSFLDLEDVLPTGSYLALKNPWLSSTDATVSSSGASVSGLCVRMDNPADVDFLSEKWIKGRFSNWGATPSTEEALLTKSLSFPAPFWTFIDVPDQMKAFALKVLGNKAFGRKNFVVAIRWYDLSLEYESENKGLTLTNKAAALMGLQCWNAALKCLEEAIAFEHCDVKVVFRKGKCLASVGKYAEAMEWLKEKMQLEQFLDSKELKDVLEDIERMEALSRDPTTLNSLLWQLQSTNNLRSDFIPEFQGPIAVRPVPGKGRGMIAEEDLKPGQLVLVTKTFALAALKPDQESPHFCSHYGRLRMILFDDLVALIANKVHFDPTLGPEVYALMAGKEMGYLEEGAATTTTSSVDIRRIHGIIKSNAYQIATDGKFPTLNFKRRNALCLRKSFFNLSCVEGNCVCTVAEGVEWIRVMKPVKKGEELLLSDLTAVDTYETRTSMYRDMGFTCSCPLCRSEAAESPELKNKRSKLRTTLGQLQRPVITMCEGQVKKILKEIKALEQASPFKGFLIWPEMENVMVGVLIAQRKYRDAVALLGKMHAVAQELGAYDRRTSPAINILRFSAEAGDEATVRLWLPKFRAMCLEFWGSLEPLKLIPQTAQLQTKLQVKWGLDLLE